MMRFRIRLLMFGIFLFATVLFYGCGGGEEESVTTSKSWYHPASLADNISPAGQDARLAQVAMDNEGNVIIVWVQSDGTNDQIFKSEYRNGVWIHPANLSDHISPAGGNASSPNVAMDNNGNAIIVWPQYNGTNWQVHKSEYREGIWTHPSSLEECINPVGYSAGAPRVAMDNNGNAIIVWRQFDGTNYQVYKSEYRSGSWVHPTSITNHINPDGYTWYPPQIAMNNRGNAIIIWTQVYETDYQVFKSEYRNDIWTHPTDSTDHISDGWYDAYHLDVAMDDQGNSIVVWSQRDSTTISQIFKSEYRNGVWAHPANLADNISPEGGYYALVPRVSMDNNSNAIIVWHQCGEDFNARVFKSEYRNGNWKHPASLSDYINPSGESAGNPQVAMNDHNTAIIVWTQYEGSNFHIFKSEYRNNVWTHPASLADNVSPDGQNATNVRVAMNNHGKIIIVWHQSDGTNMKIFKSEYR